MRNLKRALSLALASVMLLGMMVVGTSAASYPDVDENDNVEAIEVLNAVNVMIGRQGNFEPDEAVNRHEMAVIMAKLVLGVDTADNYVGTHPFTDVVPWADKYVAACYENGLVAGTSATTFSGSKNLTAVEAAAMMLRALGYKDLSKGATDWRAPITAMANQIRLFNGVASNPSQQLNRNQVAQLALNTLKSPMVNLKDNTISWTDGEGQIIMTGGGREYIALSSNEAYAKAINDTEKAGTSASQISGYTVELGEHLYNGKLKLNNNNLDVFGRPSRKWEFDGKEIGSYIKEELMVLDKVGKVTGNDLYTLLGSSTIKDYDIRTTIDGIGSERNDAKTVLGDDAYFDATDMNRNNKKEVGATGTGTLTQVFVDHEKDEVYVAVINTYLALASRDYDEKAEEATLTVYGIDDSRNNKDYVKTAKKYETMKVQNEDFALVKDVKKDDPYLVTVADGEIQTMVPDEVLEGVTLTAFKLGDHVVSDGTEYKYTTTATYNIGDLDAYTGNGKENLKDITYNIYLDAYNNLIGIKEIDAVKNYVFLAGIDLDGSNLYNKTATANALFLDGTSKTIKINMAKSKWTAHEDTLNTTNVNISGHALLNTWCTYSVNGDMYTVNEVHNINPTASKASLAQYHQYTTDYADPTTFVTKDSKVNVKYMRLNGGGNGTDGYSWVYGDSDSVYLIAELDELLDDNYANTSYAVIKDVDSVTTGIADASITVWSRDEARKQADDTKNKWDIPGDSAGKYPVPGSVGDPEHNPEYWISHGIYTLYDDEGIVIAAVIVGENEGVKDLVYVHSGGLDLESYADGTWTWTRKVIYKGEEITLTEKGDAVSDLKDMLQYHWYEIKRNANGEILSAEPAWEALGVDFVVDYSKINETVETKGDTVLYQTNDGPAPADDTAVHTHAGINNTLRVIGNNTLAVETLSGSGIHFRDNVNVVLQYWNQNTRQTEVKTGTGVDDLKSMVDFVNDNNPNRGNDLYWLSAVIEKGFATTIVIYDSYNNYDKPEQNVRYLEMPSTSTIADVNKALIDNNVKIMGAWQPNDLVDEVGDRLNTVKIPANRTLYIDGNFIAFENGTRGKGSIYVTPASTSTSKMIVNGNAWLAGQQLDCNMDVYGDLKINTAPDRGSITYLNADFNVSRDLIISDEFTGTNVRVTSGSTVTVGRDLISEKIGMDIDVYGTLNIGRRDDSVNIIHYDVLSSSTLKAGTLYGTFCVGDSSRTGRVEVGTLSTDDATGLHKGATLNNGSLVITGANYTEAFNIGDDAEARIVFGDKAADKAGVFLTEEGTQADVAGKTYVFTEKDGVITVTDANKNKVDTITGSSVDEVTDKGATEGDPTTPPTGQPIKTVTVTGLPTGTIKAGDKFTVKANTKDVTGETAVTAVAPTTKIDLTVTTTHEQGFASDVSISGWTLVEVSTDGKTAKFTKTVTVEGTTAPTDGSVIAKLSGSTYSLYSYAKGALTKAQAEAAILAAYNGTTPAPVTKATAVTIDDKTNKVTIELEDGTKDEAKTVTAYPNAGCYENPDALYKITMNGEFKKYDVFGSDIDLEGGTGVMVSKKTPVVADTNKSSQATTFTARPATTRIPSTATAAVWADDNRNVDLVDAVVMDLSSAVTGVTLTWDKAGTATTLVDDDVVALGTEIKAEANNIAAGSSIRFTVNGEVKEIVGPATAAAKKSITFKVAAPKSPATDFVIAPISGQFEVKLNGVQMYDRKDTAKENKWLKSGDMIMVDSEYLLVGANPTGGVIAGSAATGKVVEDTDFVKATAVGDQWVLQLESTEAGLASNGLLTLTSAYTVTNAGTGALWVSAIDEDITVPTDSTTDKILLVPVKDGKATAYIQQSTAGAVYTLKKADGAKIDSLTITNTVGELPPAAAGTKTVYKAIITGNVAATDIVKDKEIKVTTGGHTADWTGAPATGKVTNGGTGVNGSDISVDITVKFETTGITAGTKITASYTAESGEAGTVKSTTDVGEDGTFTVTITITKAVKGADKKMGTISVVAGTGTALDDVGAQAALHNSDT